MPMSTLEEMIDKRFPAPGWCVLWEVANGTGWKTKRHADAVAIGIWPSHGYAIHGVEIKRSRADLMREFKDPSKADAVGKYCDHWWLVLADAKIADGVQIPASWGVLAPKDQLLRVVKKAPQLKPKAVDRSFFAALVRNVMAGYVPKHEHDALKERQRDEIVRELEQTRAYQRDGLELDVQRLKATIEAFETASGVEVSSYNAGNIGAAVRTVLDLRHHIAQDHLAKRAQALDAVSSQHEYIAKQAADAAKAIRDLITTSDFETKEQ
jgi:hypothetical protein